MTTLTESTTPSRAVNFARYAWAVLVLNVLVILWGAYVRASGSGAGCGNHWPLCNGEAVPHNPRIQTVVEFLHRITSGMALLGTFGLTVWSAFLFPRGHRVRKAAILSSIFIMVEVLLGAGLVLLQLVGQNDSLGRAVYLAMHLVNTQFLLATLALTAWFARDSSPSSTRLSRIVAATLPLAILVSITGVIAALGDTLFPAASLAEGMRQDLTSGGNFLIRLRAAHPLLAVLAAAYFAAVAVSVLRSKVRPPASHIAMGVLTLSVAQLCAGAINLALLAPVAMQIGHLLLADLLWISLVLLTVEAKAA